MNIYSDSSSSASPSKPARPRAALAALAAVTLTASFPIPVSAGAAWPERPIKLVVPFAPGGSNDNIARALATSLGSRLGQPVVVENKGGAGGTIGTDAVVKAAPDGYTLLLASTSITTNAASGKKLPYDPVRDLAPIGIIGSGPFAVVVSNKLNVSTFTEFVGLARAKPNGISYGSAGIGGINHLGTELLASAAHIQLNHVPYKGIGPALTDLMGGSIQLMLPTLASSVPQIQSGTVRGLAVTSAKRSPLAPKLPTVAESGLAGFELEAWWGLLGPARLPANIVKRLNEELNLALSQAEVRELLEREGATPHPGSPQALGGLLRSDLERWRSLIKDSHIQTE